MRRIFYVTVLIQLVAVLLFAQEKAPPFRLQNLDGDYKKLTDYLKDGPVLLDFWATWCKPCVKSLPKMQQLFELYREKGLTVVAINEDSPRNRPKIKPFIKSKAITFPILLDDNSRVMRRYRFSGLPASVLISATGEVIKVYRGYRPGDDKRLTEDVRKLLQIEADDGQ